MAPRYILIHAHPEMVAEHGEAAIKVLAEYTDIDEAIEALYGLHLQESLHQLETQGSLVADPASLHAYSVEGYKTMGDARVGRMCDFYVFDPERLLDFEFCNRQYVAWQQNFAASWLLASDAGHV